MLPARAQALLRHFYLARGKHGIHSPFIYSLVTSMKLPLPPEVNKVELLRNQLMKNRQLIPSSGLGAGSSVRGNRPMRICDMARIASAPPKLGAALFHLVSGQKPSAMVELGTNLGLSAAYQSLAAPKARFITIEGNPELAAIAETNLRSIGANARVISGTFDEKLPGALAELGKLDYLFMDGNHLYEPTVRTFEAALEYLHPGSVVVMDDIHWSREMEKAWEAVKRHPRVTVTADFFRFGLAFFRTGQAGEHFRIRF